MSLKLIGCLQNRDVIQREADAGVGDEQIALQINDAANNVMDQVNEPMVLEPNVQPAIGQFFIVQEEGAAGGGPHGQDNLQENFRLLNYVS